MNKAKLTGCLCRAVALALSLLAALAAPLPALAGDLAIEGRVLTESGPLANAVVSAHRTYAGLKEGGEAAAVARTDNEGMYRLEVPQGSYFFTAAGEREGRSYFAYHGSNPLNIAEETFWLGLLATPSDGTPEYIEGTSGVTGKITYRGKPLDGAFIALYKPESRTFKGLGVKTESVAADGSFKLNIEPGSYVVTARKLSDGKSNRPVQQGDLFCYYSRNPVEIKPDRQAKIEFSCYPRGSREDFVPAKKIKSASLKSFQELADSSKAGIRGKVTDQAGRPIAGMNVLAYRLTAPVFMMYHVYHGSEYSARTDRQGNFFIPLDSDGDYGLVARDTLGDGPHRGELYGLYQGNVRHAVTFKRGELLEDIPIVAGKVMDDADRSATAPRAPVTVTGSEGGPPVVLRDSVISNDTVWQGEIIIQGVVNVKRGATLVIRPGTKVRFRKIDRDRNEVGDGEILVEGRLVAKGTPERRIVFTSAEDTPAPGDWSYLQFLASGKGSVIEQCIFEYAFAGVMIHYADVRISDTLFRNNNRGLHYNTADLTVDHCTFIDNRIGIRFMRMEGNVKITNCHISENDIGVLFVRQHVNAVNFEQLNRGQETPLYRDNNIHANRSYNFSLGEEQDRDISVSGNWWGGDSLEKTRDMMYDRSKNPSLSRILFEPYLEMPVKGAGVQGMTPELIFQNRKTAGSSTGGQAESGLLSGRFMRSDGKPLSGAILYLYNLARGPLPSPHNRYWRVPNQTAEIDGDGRFVIEAPPGEYCVGAIQRPDGLQIGPPRTGDTFVLALDEAEQPRIFALQRGAMNNLGEIREVRQTAPKPRSAPETSIQGLITDSYGKALEGILVFGFTTPAVAGKPLYVSGPSDARGRFRLNVAEGGTYYLKVRSDIGGGPPQAGLTIDGNRLEPLVQVSVDTGGSTSGVVLKTKTFPGRGRSRINEPAGK